MRLSWKYLVLVGILLVTVFLALISWQALAIRKESEYHEYSYSVSISAPSLLENCTLLLPVPSAGNRSILGEALVRGEGYYVPPGWKLSIGRVNNTPMLGISAPSIVPEYHGYPIPMEPGSTPVETPPPAATARSSETPVLIPIHFGVSLKAREPIDTRNPFGREPLFSSPGSYRPVPCRDPSRSGECYRFTVPVSIDCLSGGMGHFTLSISAGGTNQWWLGGWSGNSYGESIELTLVDTRKGWIPVEGTLSTGVGRYEGKT